MSGSGSTCFGLYKSQEIAKKAANHARSAELCDAATVKRPTEQCELCTQDEDSSTWLEMDELRQEAEGED